MAVKDPSYSPLSVSSAIPQPVDPADLQAERLCFFGSILATIAYGALFMLYVQLAGVLIARPKRGITFWAIVTYSVLMFPLATIAVGTIITFSEESYIDNRNYPGGPYKFYRDYASDYVHVLGEVSAVLFSWLADILMLVRLWVIWNSSWWMLAFPLLMYIAKLAVSIPLMIAVARSNPTPWQSSNSMTYHALTIAFNIYTTCMVCLRLQMLRPKLEAVAGKLHASFYTSFITTFVESGGFFTMWLTAHLVALISGSPVQFIFFFPIPFAQGVTRMLLILRIAQDRAWSRDLVQSTQQGDLDWQVATTRSIPLHDIPSTADFSTGKLSRKF